MGLGDLFKSKPLGVDPASVRHKVGVRLAMARCDSVTDNGDEIVLTAHWGMRYLFPLAFLGILTVMLTFFITGNVFTAQLDAAQSVFQYVFLLPFIMLPVAFVYAAIFVLPTTNTVVSSTRIEQRRVLVVIPFGTRRYEAGDIADVVCEPAKMPNRQHNGGIAHAVVLRLRDGREVLLRYHEDKARVDAAVKVMRETLRLRESS